MIDRWTKTDFDDAALLKSGLSFHKDAIKINGYYKISMNIHEINACWADNSQSDNRLQVSVTEFWQMLNPRIRRPESAWR